MKFNKGTLFFGIIAFSSYFSLLVFSVLMEMYDIAIGLALFLIIVFCFFMFRRIVFMKFGTKKKGYICYYNDNYEIHTSHGSLPGVMNNHKVDIIIDSEDGEERVSAYANLDNMNTEKFLKMKTSGKTIYIDVYIFWKFYYVDCKSVRID